MNLIKFRKILNRYAKGNANETERALVEAWYKSYSVNEVQLEDSRKEQLRNSILAKVEQSVFKQKKLYLYISGIAASLIVVAAYFLILKNNHKHITYASFATGTNGLRQIKLADGSVVWLNANSKIIAPKAFYGDLRQVSLTEGEAFFKIKKDPSHPFVINLGALKVKVLGTSFDIKAYKAFNAINVSVTTGRVAVIANDKTLKTLIPGQQLHYNLKDKNYEVTEVDSEKNMSWKDGTTYLEEADFNELALIVKNIYGINIKPGNKKAAQYRFSLKLIHQLNHQEILALIAQLHNSQFRKEGDDLVLY
jgi:transmembrane sensor